MKQWQNITGHYWFFYLMNSHTSRFFLTLTHQVNEENVERTYNKATWYNHEVTMIISSMWSKDSQTSIYSIVLNIHLFLIISTISILWWTLFEAVLHSTDSFQPIMIITKIQSNSHLFLSFLYILSSLLFLCFQSSVFALLSSQYTAIALMHFYAHLLFCSERKLATFDSFLNILFLILRLS